MRKHSRRWFPLAALLATAPLAGCTIEVVGEDRDAAAGGAAGATLDSGRGDVDAQVVLDGSLTDSAVDRSAVDGAAGDAAEDAAPAVDVSDAGDASACYVDEAVADGGDAGDGRPPCSTLRYFGNMCTETGDAGSMNVDAYGVKVCERFRGELKPSAFRALFACLDEIPSGAANCSPPRGKACMAPLFARTSCELPSETVDGGTFGCAEVAASCRPGDAGAGITQDDCTRWLHPFNAAVRSAAFECYTAPENAVVPCADRFENYCVFSDDIRP